MEYTLSASPKELTSGFPSVERNLRVDYSLNGETISRTAEAGRFSSSSRIRLANMLPPDNGCLSSMCLAHIWNLFQLNGGRPQVDRDPSRQCINVVDLFCGCGGLSLGLKRAAEAVGARPVFLLAADVDKAALDVYSKNLRPLRGIRQNIKILVDYESRLEDIQSPSASSVYLDDELTAIAGSVDIFLAGPPCEGNSNFNNWTRRFDNRNDLYLDATIAGIALGAKVIVIENVPEVIRSHQDVVNRSLCLLQQSGYNINHNEFTLKASDFGTPQTRSRHFLVAGRSDFLPSLSDFSPLKIPAPTVSEAIKPLGSLDRETTFDQPSRLSAENTRRVNFLFKHDRYDLPNEERPACHRLKEHSYPSVYGRLRPDAPAPTITTGFLSPGRGRFTHPFEARSLTPHEGARLQGFSEDFDWLSDLGTVTRSDYANMIGAAVPPQLSFAIGLFAISLL